MKFINIFDDTDGVKTIYRIPRDNIGNIISEENTINGTQKIKIVDRMNNDLYVKEFKDAYLFDNKLEKIECQMEE